MPKPTRISRGSGMVYMNPQEYPKDQEWYTQPRGCTNIFKLSHKNQNLQIQIRDVEVNFVTKLSHIIFFSYSLFSCPKGKKESS